MNIRQSLTGLFESVVLVLAILYGAIQDEFGGVFEEVLSGLLDDRPDVDDETVHDQRPQVDGGHVLGTAYVSVGLQKRGDSRWADLDCFAVIIVLATIADAL